MKLRENIISISIYLSILLVGCSTSSKISYQRSGEVEYISSKNKGVITVNSKGFASDRSAAVYYAERNAMENILFKGIPGSNQRQPIVSNEESAWQNHANVLNKLLNDDYGRFIMNSETSNSSEGSPVEIQRIITIDINALRKHLETEGVVRKFGY